MTRQVNISGVIFFFLSLFLRAFPVHSKKNPPDRRLLGVIHCFGTRHVTGSRPIGNRISLGPGSLVGNRAKKAGSLLPLSTTRSARFPRRFISLYSPLRSLAQAKTAFKLGVITM